MRGVTLSVPPATAASLISTRTPHAGSDPSARLCPHKACISTRTPHAGSDYTGENNPHLMTISTRTPHAGSDHRPRMGRRTERISTRTPHAGSDASRVDGAVGARLFQPALPMRGVTCDCMTYSNCVLFQPALPMRGVTAATVDGIARILISTRTPHAGSDAKLTRYSLPLDD